MSWLIDDRARLETLEYFGILGSAPKARFDQIVFQAAQVAEMPIGVINLIGGDRQFFKARHGFELDAPALEQSLCVHCLAAGRDLTIVDLSHDPRTADLAWVAGAPHFRFYAAIPIVVRGQALGTLAVLDTKPHFPLNKEQMENLRRLAQCAAEMIEDDQKTDLPELIAA